MSAAEGGKATLHTEWQGRGQNVAMHTKVFDTLDDFLEWFDQVGQKVMITQTICTTTITVVYSDYEFDEIILSMRKLD